MQAADSATRRRVQFVFPCKTLEALDLLKEELGASSRTEVLKTAIELLRWAMSHLSRGEEIRATRDEELLETIAIPGAHFPRSAKGEKRR